MLDALTVTPDIAGAALAGLSATPKTLPPSLFYDEAGVALFDAITRLPEYYLTRTERALLAQVAPQIASLAAPGSVLVEYGASDEAKAAILLDAAAAKFAAYVPIDVAGGALDAMSARLHASRPNLRVHPFCGDFLRPIVLPARTAAMPRFGFFPGSTIGNLDRPGATAFLAEAAATLGDKVDNKAGQGAWLIVGADLHKSEHILIPAYNDAAGVTAAFNLNLLHRLNREAAANFDLAAFRHRAVWNAEEGRIEMHLESLHAQTVRLAGTEIAFARGETIHTENSYKHTVDGLQSLAEAAGWHPRHVWTDDANMFAIHALQLGGSVT